MVRDLLATWMWCRTSWMCPSVSKKSRTSGDFLGRSAVVVLLFFGFVQAKETFFWLDFGTTF